MSEKVEFQGITLPLRSVRESPKEIGDGIYNHFGAGQSLSLKVEKKPSRFYISSESDGNAVGDFLVREKRPKKGLKSKLFRMTGSRTNITASVNTSGFPVQSLAPGGRELFQGRDQAMSRSKNKILFSVGRFNDPTA